MDMEIPYTVEERPDTGLTSPKLGSRKSGTVSTTGSSLTSPTRRCRSTHRMVRHDDPAGSH